MAIYMKYGSIKGDATHAGFDGWINVIHFEWLIDWQIANRAAVQGNTRDARRPKIGEFTIKKEAEWRLQRQPPAAICTSNKLTGTCPITFVRTGGIDIPLIGLFIPDKYVEYQFNAALITHFDTNAGLGEAERPIETFKFNFTEFKLDVWQPRKREHETTAEKLWSVQRSGGQAGIGAPPRRFPLSANGDRRPWTSHGSYFSLRYPKVTAQASLPASNRRSSAHCGRRDLWAST